VSWLSTEHGQFVVGFDDGVLVVFAIKSGKQIYQYSLNYPINKIVAFSHASLIAIAHDNGKLTLFDSNERKVIGAVDCDEPVSSIAFD